MLLDEERDKLLRWLVQTNPSGNHNTAMSRHDADTGAWLAKSPEYQAWQTLQTRLLWFYGIPGAGKTVLFSHIVESTRSRYPPTTSPSRGNGPSNDITACVFYYCHHSHARDETGPLLRWIIDQLVRSCGHLPNELLDCYRAGHQPSIPMLWVAFSSLVVKFRRIYLFVDALDESLERQNLLDLLLNLSGPEFDNVSLLAMSRDELDIRDAIGGYFTNISLSNPYVDEDIRIYVCNQLKTHPKLKKLPPILQKEVEDGLVEGSKGMLVAPFCTVSQHESSRLLVPFYSFCTNNFLPFPRFRWASCQIEILGHLRTAAHIREALKEQPETLEGIYERILTGIHLKSRIFAQRVLSLLAFHGRRFAGCGVASLADAVASNPDDPESSDTSEPLFSPDELFAVCSCLVVKNKAGDPELAHYTVKEYLVSKRISLGPAHEFYVTEQAADQLFIKTLLFYTAKKLQHVAVEFQKASNSDCYERRFQRFSSEFPLTNIASRYIFSVDDPHGCHPLYFLWCYEEAKRDKEFVGRSLIQFFDPESSIFPAWVAWQTGLSRHYRRRGGGFPVWVLRPGLEGHVALAYACHTNAPDEIIIQICSRFPGLATSVRRLLLDCRTPCSNNNSLWKHGFPQGTPLEIAAGYGNSAAVRTLLEKGASPNRGGDSFGPTALCMAVASARHNFNSVQYLLRGGADPNPSRVPQTPLQIAVMGQWPNPQIVGLLLERGADVDAVGSDEATGLEIREGHTSCMHCEGASVAMKPLFMTPLQIANSATVPPHVTGSNAARYERENLKPIREMLQEYRKRNAPPFRKISRLLINVLLWGQPWDLASD